MLAGIVHHTISFPLHFGLSWLLLITSVAIVTAEEKEATNLRESKVGVHRRGCVEERERGNGVITL